MGTSTAKLKLYRPATVGEAVSVQSAINDNMDKIESLLPFTICTSGARPASPFQGQTIYETDTGFVYFYNGAAWKKWVLLDTTETVQNKTFDATNTWNGVLNPTFTSSMKNRFINGSFDIWQRGTPVTNTGGVIGYTADRWQATSGTGATNIFTRTANTLGAVAGQAKYRCDWNRSVAGTTDSTFQQKIEGVQSFAGQQVTVSAYLTASAGSIDFQFRSRQFFGTTGGSADVGPTAQGGTQTATTARTRFTATFTVPSIAGKTLGSAGDDCLEIQLFRAFNATNGATGTLQVEDLVIELGPVATDIERPSVQQTLAWCERYYYRLTAVNGTTYFGSGRLSTATNADIHVHFPVTMRIAPISSAISGNTHITINAASSAASTATSTNLGFGNVDGALVNATVVGLVAGQGCLAFLNTIGAWIEFNSELTA